MSEVNVERDQIRLLNFRLGAERFAVDILDVQEIVRVNTVTRLPCAPAHVRGVVNLRGRLLTINDLRHRLGMEPCEQGAQSSILVLACVLSGHRIVRGFLVENVDQVIDVSRESIAPPPPLAQGLDLSCFRGIARTDSGLVRVLDVAALLRTEDTLEVASP